MKPQGSETGDYVVPTYTAAANVPFYHFLHGNVPGYQVDFIYRPEVPQGPLTEQHFDHLWQLVACIEPRRGSAFAFAVGNLSRDDTQYEPGRGGIALIFGLRIRGARDHSGWQIPPFCHALAAIDRHLDEPTLLEASMAFYRKLLPDEQSQREGTEWYHTYVEHAEDRDALLPVLRAYVADFNDLPLLRSSVLGFRWTVEGGTPPKRIVIVHGDSEPFEAIAACAARIAAVLIESDIPWTVISTGREGDLQSGVSIRFVPQREVGPKHADARVLRMQHVPHDPKELAGKLFGAQDVHVSPVPDHPIGGQQLYDKPMADASGLRPGQSDPSSQPPSPGAQPPDTSVQPPAAAEAHAASGPPAPAPAAEQAHAEPGARASPELDLLHAAEQAHAEAAPRASPELDLLHAAAPAHAESGLRASPELDLLHAAEQAHAEPGARASPELDPLHAPKHAIEQAHAGAIPGAYAGDPHHAAEIPGLPLQAAMDRVPASAQEPADKPTEAAKKPRAQAGLWVALGVAVAIGGAIAAVAITVKQSPSDTSPLPAIAPPTASPSATQRAATQPGANDSEKTVPAPQASAPQTPSAAAAVAPPKDSGEAMSKPPAPAMSTTGAKKSGGKKKPRSMIEVP